MLDWRAAGGPVRDLSALCLRLHQAPTSLLQRTVLFLSRVFKRVSFTMGISSKSRYDSVDQFPPEQQKKKFWDPVTILDIINPSRGCLTCVGYAPSCGRRCRNPINSDNRASAFRLLEDLSYIDTSTTDINAKLHQLARLTLCLRFHQSQKNDMVEKWCRKTDQQQTATRNSTNTKIDPDRMEERLKDLEKLLARVLSKAEGADEFIFSSPAGQRYRKQYDRQSAQEEQARKRQEEETRKSREQEREREQKHQQQKREKTEREEKERKKREEEKRRKEEQQARDREAREREERNERIRRRAEQARKERERKAREQAAKEREEWDKVWLHYVLRWDDIKKNSTKGTSEKLREMIPWPVKSGNWRDVSESAVEEFFHKAPPPTTGADKMLAIMKMECLKWHADRIPRMFGMIDSNLAGLFNTVTHVAIKIRAETGRQREQ
ncbi:hypothetical protein K458DRAFT_437492 [Lentithecium fluviatile CBS 122367]|uniref:Uncharacterized protein n=1 Tax=Lentithecium fluviatile CBS 122367 TaxID=1168545 RepID=A0A6G1IDP3_9PLEO|nr:hypothetical protein K458DRAFT_437492 [Lentithecium fluviatile CBS 122367]